MAGGCCAGMMVVEKKKFNSGRADMQLSLYDQAFLMDLKSFVIGVMKKTAGLNDLSCDDR